MSQKKNYQHMMEEIIEECKRDNRVPSLLLHSCCGPCSSYVLMVLSQTFEVTVYYYNPNIYPEEEYRMRVREQKRFIDEFPVKHPVVFMEGTYDTERFYQMARGLEDEPERGGRCRKCYRLRLSQTAEAAGRLGFDFFATTLSISPQKDAGVLNEIGCELSKEYGVNYLYSDFKKKDGYLKSVRLSAEYGMYRQNYCGCEFSLKNRA